MFTFCAKFWQKIVNRIKTSLVFGRGKATKGIIALTHRRIFIVPTSNGFGFVLLLTVLMLMAFVYNNNLAYLLSFLLISLFVITILHTFRSLSGLRVSLGVHKPVFCGQALALPLLIDNPSPIARYQLEVQLEETTRCDVQPLSQQQVNLHVTPLQRGWYHCGTIRITSRFPLGLFRAWSLLRFDQPVLVYPKPTSQSSPIPNNTRGQQDIGYLVKGEGEDFYGLQEYRAGDAIKQIHWKTFAKGQGVFTKQYSQGQAAELWLDYTTVPGHDTEERLSQLCRWILDAEAAGIKYGLNLPGNSLPPAQGAQHQASCLQALALF